MTQVALQYAVGSKLTDAFEDLRVVGYEVIADVDASESPYTADYTITAQDQAMAFLVLSNATLGTKAVTLYHGTTHAAQLDTRAIYQGGGDGTNVPSASVTLDMAVAADRRAVIMVNPGAQDADGVGAAKYLGLNDKISLQLVTDGSYSDGSTVVIVALAGKLRNSPGTNPV